MRRTTVVALAASLAVSGCTAVGVALSGRPGYPGLHVNRELARTHGCDYAEIRSAVDSLESAQEGPPPVYVLPAPGDDRCRVLSYLGRPDGFSVSARGWDLWVYHPSPSAPATARLASVYVTFGPDGRGVTDVTLAR